MQVDASLKELEELYNESKSSDIISLRLNTLFERLKILSATEQFIESKKKGFCEKKYKLTLWGLCGGFSKRKILTKKKKRKNL